MAKPKTSKSRITYQCQNCGTKRSKWEGRCSDCGTWNSFVEEAQAPLALGPEDQRGWMQPTQDDRIFSLDEVESDPKQLPRHSTGSQEFDRVLGGGVHPGCFTLVGGDPGIGKSTLLLQSACHFCGLGMKVLYVSAEESVSQTSLRAKRLQTFAPSLRVGATSNLNQALEWVASYTPDVLVVDSIQTVYWPEMGQAPGSVSQVRECAARLLHLSKRLGISVFIVGHVNKEGGLAGPKVLEHMVDTVLSFEGDPNNRFRLLRSVKNRFGPANELGVFNMSHTGMEDVANPSEFFLEDRREDRIGAALFAAVEGSRPLLCEIQGLVAHSGLSMPRRTAIGVDHQRLQLLSAVLDRHLRLEAGQKDIYVNVVGGLKLSEPAADLAVAAAVLSSHYGVPLSQASCYFGEVGLTGEIRACQMPEERLREAQRLGVTKAFLPTASEKHLKDLNMERMKLVYVSQIRELRAHLQAAAETR